MPGFIAATIMAFAMLSFAASINAPANSTTEVSSMEQNGNLTESHHHEGSSVDHDGNLTVTHHHEGSPVQQNGNLTASHPHKDNLTVSNHHEGSSVGQHGNVTVSHPHKDNLILSNHPKGSPVGQHGNLIVKGNQTLDQNGMPVNFHGMSFFWEVWMSKYWNEDVIKWLTNDWKASIVRLAMGVEPDNGYLDKPKDQKKTLETVVNAAIQAGIYVIIDWHDHHAHLHVNESIKFFDEMAKTYGQYPNVLFEIFNEPMDNDWPTIKAYHQKVVDVIRNQTDNIVILGTPSYSQDVDIASEDPVNGTNLLYTLHFYAASHKGALRNKARKAMSNGIGLMVTEWGTCDYTGNGTLDFDSTRTWMEFLDENHISSCNWAISDKYEACSALMPGASPSGNWTTKAGSDLTYSGALVRHLIRGTDTGETCSAPGWPCAPPKCAAKSTGCKKEECCMADGESCFEKDAGWAQCMPSCTPGIHTTDAKEYQTPWSCKVLGQPPPGPPWTIISKGRRYVALDVVLVAFAILLLVCFGVIACLLCKRSGQANPNYHSASQSP